MVDDNGISRDPKTGKVTEGSIRKVAKIASAKGLSRRVREMLKGMFPDKDAEMVPYAVMAQCMADTEAEWKDRTKAAQYLSERMHGKPVQALELSGPAGAPIQTDSQVTHNVPPAERIVALFKTFAVLDKHGGVAVHGGDGPVDGEPASGSAGGPVATGSGSPAT